MSLLSCGQKWISQRSNLLKTWINGSAGREQNPVNHQPSAPASQPGCLKTIQYAELLFVSVIYQQDPNSGMLVNFSIVVSHLTILQYHLLLYLLLNHAHCVSVHYPEFGSIDN